MKKGDLVVYTGRGTSAIEGMFGLLLEDPSKHINGSIGVNVYFANAPRWPKRIINVEWLRLANESR